MGFSRQGYWNSLSFPSPGDLLDPGIEPRSPALQADSLPTELPGKPQRTVRCLEFHTYLISFVAKRGFKDTWLPQTLQCILDLLEQGLHCFIKHPLIQLRAHIPMFLSRVMQLYSAFKTKESGGLQSMGLQKVRHDWAINTSLFLFQNHSLVVNREEEYQWKST